MRLEILVALRYIKAKKGISLINICGVAVGVACIIIVLSVMNGFRLELERRILGATPHIVVTKANYELMENADSLKAILQASFPEILAISPFIFTKTLAKTENSSDGVVVRGIVPEYERKVVSIENNIILGDFNFNAHSPPALVLGCDLAKILRVSLNDEVTLISPAAAIKTPLGWFPRAQTFKVTGIFDAGMYEYNSSLIYIPLSEAQKLLDCEKKVTGLELRINSLYKARDLAKKINKVLGPPFFAMDWQSLNKNLFAALRLEKVVTFIVLTLLIIVACFSIVATLTMLVIRKTKEIGILKALGTKTFSVTKIFITYGILVGLIGSLIGATIGILTSLLLSTYRFINLPADIYFIKNLPTRLLFSDVLITVLCALLISFLATIYPARKAANLVVVDALRYE